MRRPLPPQLTFLVRSRALMADRWLVTPASCTQEPMCQQATALPMLNTRAPSSVRIRPPAVRRSAGSSHLIGWAGPHRFCTQLRFPSRCIRPHRRPPTRKSVCINNQAGPSSTERAIVGRQQSRGFLYTLPSHPAEQQQRCSKQQRGDRQCQRSQCAAPVWQPFAAAAVVSGEQQHRQPWRRAR